MEIIPAHTAEWLDTVRMLFREYAAEINTDLCFQGFERELAELPGAYAPPAGRLLLACWRPDDPTAPERDRPFAEYAGCVALRPLEGGACEMKRMYVRPVWRRCGLGRRLALTVIEAAREIGYTRMRLDTIDTMQPAIALYHSLGFVSAPPYYHNPLRGATYMELDLTAALHEAPAGRVGARADPPGGQAAR